MSAPAAFAASAFLPLVNTATRTLLPMPCGITVEPRTCWSDLLASMPRFTATSTDSANFAVANSFTRLSASSTGYCRPGASFAFHGAMRLGNFISLAEAAISHPLHVDAHAAGAAGDRAHGGVQVRGGDVRHLHLRDVFQLLARDLAHLRRVRRAAALFDADRLADQYGRGRRLQNEREAAVAVHRDHHGCRQALLQLLGLRIERLAEFHDVHALLTERRTDRRT